MEIRVLRYFLAIAREESITGAAASLHLTQPTLSRQVRDLEEELGHPLFVRGSQKITLTEEGMILRKRAEEILELVRRTENEIALTDEDVAGEVCFASAETEGVRYFAKAMNLLRQCYPGITYQIHSGNSAFVRERIDRGLADFGLLYDTATLSDYETLMLPCRDRWGVLLRRDSPLAEKEFITPSDLRDKPLILPHPSNGGNALEEWFSAPLEELNVVSTFTLAYNASILVREGVGYALMFDKLIHTEGSDRLCFRPLSPALESRGVLIWKKYRELGRAQQKVLEVLREVMVVKSMGKLV